MPTQEHDSWLSALGVDVDKARSWVSKQVDALSDDVTKAEDWSKAAVQKGVDWAKTEARATVGEVKAAVGAVKRDADAVKTKALGDQSGKPVPRPMEADCKPVHGYVPGPNNYLLCATHGHVVDTDQQTIIASSVAAYLKQSAAAAVKSADPRADLGGGLQLKPPQLGGAPQPGLPPNLQLHFHLSADELAACNQYLDTHFDAAAADGASPVLTDSYKPALDGKPVEIDAVVQALIPLTLASGSKDASEQLYKDTTSQLYDLVNARYASLVQQKTKVAMDAASKGAVQNVVDASAEAQAWVRGYLTENHLRPNVVDDGTGDTVLFDDEATPFDKMVSTAVAAGRLANLKSGDQGRSLITTDMVTRIARDMLAAAVPTVPKSASSGAQNISLYLQYTFTPETTHTPIAGGGNTSDQPAHALTGQMTWEFHGDNQAGAEVSAFGQLTWFADDKGGHIKNQSGFTGAQVAWVWTFLNGALQAGPLFQALVGASRAQQKMGDKLVWTPTGQVAAGGQIQYAIPGFKGHLLVGVQAVASATDATGSDATVDRAAAFTFTFKL
jgi:hypothetical protein